MYILPAIDIRNGQVVRLEQGRAEALTVYPNTPTQAALSFYAAGAKHVHIVDLDGAFTGEPKNLPIISDIAIEQALATGIHRVVIGTRACESLPFIRAIVTHFGADKIAVGLGAKAGIVASQGWLVPSRWLATDLAQAVAEQGIQTIIYTDIATNGMFTGPNIAELTALNQAVPQLNIIASGGIAHINHIKTLSHIQGVEGAIIGSSLHFRSYRRGLSYTLPLWTWRLLESA